MGQEQIHAYFQLLSYQDQGMVFVHQIMAHTSKRGAQSAAGKAQVQPSKKCRYGVQ